MDTTGNSSQILISMLDCCYFHWRFLVICPDSVWEIRPGRWALMFFSNKHFSPCCVLFKFMVNCWVPWEPTLQFRFYTPARCLLGSVTFWFPVHQTTDLNLYPLQLHCMPHQQLYVSWLPCSFCNFSLVAAAWSTNLPSPLCKLFFLVVLLFCDSSLPQSVASNGHRALC